MKIYTVSRDDLLCGQTAMGYIQRRVWDLLGIQEHTREAINCNAILLAILNQTQLMATGPTGRTIMTPISIEVYEGTNNLHAAISYTRNPHEPYVGASIPFHYIDSIQRLGG